MPLRINVWHGKDEDSVYRRGEKVRVRFEASQDAYAVVYRIDAEGLVSILWPRSRYDDGFVFGHHEYKLPQSGGPAIRASQEEGVEYIEAVLSNYPFDLRELEVDFLHEQGDENMTLYVAGDPFLAMNEVNFAVTGLEDPEDYVVTNYASYYVHQQVEHPRYLCVQCHEDDDVAYHPYRDSCTVNIQYDYGWSNRWYLRYGYFPVYYYPAYYYVDPWTFNSWVNYVYDPWYHYPSVHVYHWPHRHWYWNHSPYYRGNCYTWNDHGHRRCQPINRRPDQGRSPYRVGSGKNSVIADGRPAGRITDAMRTRTKIEAGRPELARGARANTDRVSDKYRNVGAAKRDKTVFRPETRTRTRPGIVIRDGSGQRATKSTTTGQNVLDRTRPTIRTGRGSTIPGVKPTLRSQNTSTRGKTTQRSGQGSIRTVKPRNKSSQIWNGNRSSGGTSTRGSKSPTVKPASPRSSPKSSAKSSNVRSSSGSKSGSSSRSKVAPRSSSGSSKSSGTRSSGGSKSGGSSKSSGGSKKSSGSKKKG